MSHLLEWGAYAHDKNTSARLCAKNAGGGGAYARGGAYLRDTTVNSLEIPTHLPTVYKVWM